MKPVRAQLAAPAAAPALLLFLLACGSDPFAGGAWSGSIDTLATGEIVVRNTADPLWAPEDAWQVVEELRIGEAASVGPDLFGSIHSIDADAQGRIYVLEGQAQEVRIFDRDGAFVRTVGRRGEGPGEFTGAVAVDVAPSGEMWVMDGRQGRVSIFDTAGVFLRQEPAQGGYMELPYSGGFDPGGRYNVVVGAGNAMARFDQSFNLIDSMAIPEPGEIDTFLMVDEEGRPRLTVAVPFQGAMRWRFSPAGTVWTLLTDRYELAEMTTGGVLLRTITKEHEPIPVTDEDLEEAVASLSWFTRQGGRIDRSKFPASKPSTVSFLVDDEGSLWVLREVSSAEMDNEGRFFDVFDGDGRFLGSVRLGFSPGVVGLTYLLPRPSIKDGMFYGVTSDADGVQYLVRARIVKPAAG